MEREREQYILKFFYEFMTFCPTDRLMIMIYYSYREPVWNSDPVSQDL